MQQKILITILISLILGLTYFSGRTAGYTAGEKDASTVYADKIKEYQEAINRQTDTLNKALDIKAVDLTQEVNSLLKDTQQIRIALKNQP